MQVLNDLTEDQALTVLRAHDSSSSTALQQLLSKLPESQHRLALLAHAPSLESHHCLNLPISYPPITAQAMHAAVFFTALQSLHVCPWLSPQELHSTLRSIEALPNLTCLDLSGTHHISKEACTALSQTICKLTKLQVLRCDQCGLTTAACLALFPALSALHELRSLSLGRHIKGIEGDQGVTIITPTCARVLSAQFRHITKLTSLCLVGVKLNNEAAEVITRKLHKLPQLCVIDLRGAHASMDGFWSFQKACWACTTPPAQLELLLNQVFSITQVPKPNDSIPCVRSISYQLDASGSSHLHNPQSISAPSMPLPHVTKLVLQVLCMRHEGLPLANMLSNLPNLAHLDILLGDVGAGVPHIKGKEVVPLIAPIAALTYLTFLSWDHDNYGRSCRYARRFAPVLASLPFLQHLHLEIRGFYDPERADQAQRAQHKTVTEDPLVGCFASLAQLTHLTIAFCNGYLLASLGPVLPCMHRLKRLKLEDSSFYSTEPQRPYAEGLHAVATYATALSNLESLVLRLAAQNPEIEGVTSIIDALHKSSALTQLVVCAKSRTRGSRSESHQVALQLARSIGTLPLLQHLSCAVDCWCDGLTGALLPSKHYCLTRLEFRVPLDCDSTPMQYQTRRKAEVPSGQVIARSLCCAPQLAVLIVDACEITEADLQPLNALSLLPNLTTFSIRYFRISKAAASALGYALEGLNLPELATVRIELDEKPNVYPHSELRCETLQRIVQKLPKLPSLRNLSLGAIDGEHMIQQSPEIMAAAGQFGASLAAVISTTFRLQVCSNACACSRLQASNQACFSLWYRSRKHIQCHIEVGSVQDMLPGPLEWCLPTPACTGTSVLIATV